MFIYKYSGFIVNRVLVLKVNVLEKRQNFKTSHITVLLFDMKEPLQMTEPSTGVRRANYPFPQNYMNNVNTCL